MPLCAVFGSGSVNVIGLWNFLRLGSMVTQALGATRLPSSLLTNSGCIGKTCGDGGGNEKGEGCGGGGRHSW